MIYFLKKLLGLVSIEEIQDRLLSKVEMLLDIDFHDRTSLKFRIHRLDCNTSKDQIRELENDIDFYANLDSVLQNSIESKKILSAMVGKV